MGGDGGVADGELVEGADAGGEDAALDGEVEHLDEVAEAAGAGGEAGIDGGGGGGLGAERGGGGVAGVAPGAELALEGDVLRGGDEPVAGRGGVGFVGAGSQGAAAVVIGAGESAGGHGGGWWGGWARDLSFLGCSCQQNLTHRVGDRGWAGGFLPCKGGFPLWQRAGDWLAMDCLICQMAGDWPTISCQSWLMGGDWLLMSCQSWQAAGDEGPGSDAGFTPP